MKLKYFGLLIFTINSHLLIGQDTLSITSHKVGFKTKIEFTIDTRNSFIRDEAVNVYGASIGLKVSKRSHCGIGFYTLSEASKQMYNAKTREGPIAKQVPAELSLYFISLYYRYQFLTLGKFDFSTPVELGLGRSKTSFLDANGALLVLPKFQNPNRAFFVPVQIGLNVHWRLLKWLTPKFSLGYRYTLYSFKGNIANARKVNYNGLYYSYGVAINFGILYRKIFPKNK